MSRSYSGILEGDRVRWTGAAPAERGPVRVNVTVVGPATGNAAGDPTHSGNGDGERGRRMAEALAALADSGTFSGVTDPRAWQRDTRADRPLPGREGDEAPPAPDAP